MQKVVKFLEAYVQWVALGLGLLWVLWMGYSYWAATPVSTTINNEKVAPGDIDDVLLNSTPVDGLDKAAKNEGPYPPEIRALLEDRSQSDLITPFKERLATSTAPQAWSSPFPGGVPQQINPKPTEGIAAGEATMPEINGTFGLETGANDTAVQTGMSVVKRPDPTVPVVLDTRSGQTNFQQQDLLQPPDTSLINPVGPNGQPQGANPADPNQPPQAPKPIAIVPEEVTWVTVSGALDMKKLAEAFQKAKIPAPAAFTSVLRVELVRQELQPTGEWSNEQVVKDLTNQFKPQFPNDANADQGLQAAYLQWAQQHVADVVEPAFYEVLRGMLWKTAAMPDLADANNPNNVQQTSFDPATVKPGQVNSLPLEQRQAWLKWKQDKDKAEAQQHRAKQTATPAGGYGGRGGMPGEPFFAPQTAGPDPAMIERYKQEAQRRYQQQQQAAPARPQITGAEMPFDATMPGGVQQPNRGPTAQDLPPSPFSPAQQNKDLEVWAHDETTVPGKIYRYKLRIFIKNPMWGTQGMAKNQADSNVFALKTETDWTKPVNSPSKRDFFVTNGGANISGVPKVGVEYFEWVNGAWAMKPLSVQPGDRIGETPWTVADIRPISGGANNENRVLLVNDDGSVASRFYKTDKARKEYKELQSKVAPPTPPPGAQPNQPAGFGAVGGASGEIPFGTGGARGGH